MAVSLTGICMAASYSFVQEFALEDATLQPMLLSKVLEELVPEETTSYQEPYLVAEGGSPPLAYCHTQHNVVGLMRV